MSTMAVRGLQIFVRVWLGQLIARGEFLCPLLPAYGLVFFVCKGFDHAFTFLSTDSLKIHPFHSERRR